MASGEQGGAGNTRAALQSSAALPAFNAKNALLTVGSASLLGMVHFYRSKHTRGFKACWALM
jgi:hypothetical protein